MIIRSEKARKIALKKYRSLSRKRCFIESEMIKLAIAIEGYELKVYPITTLKTKKNII